MNAKISKKLSSRGKIGLAILVTAMLVSVASAALLPYYGQIETTVDVSPSTLVDGNDYTIPVIDSFDATAGDTICRPHWIDNLACIDSTIGLATPEEEGITVTYYKPIEYSYSQEWSGLGVTVEDTGDGWLLWTYTYADEPTHTPKMTVAINYPNGFCITTFDNEPTGDWYYAPDGGEAVWFAEYSGGSYEDWVVTTASGSVLTVKILKSALDDTFLWHGYANYNGNQVWIEIDENWLPTGEATIREEFTSLTLQPGERLDFVICYEFALDTTPDTYIITTTVTPVV